MIPEHPPPDTQQGVYQKIKTTPLSCISALSRFYLDFTQRSATYFGCTTHKLFKLYWKKFFLILLLCPQNGRKQMKRHESGQRLPLIYQEIFFIFVTEQEFL
jgi:hypothetical protein